MSRVWMLQWTNWRVTLIRTRTIVILVTTFCGKLKRLQPCWMCSNTNTPHEGSNHTQQLWNLAFVWCEWDATFVHSDCTISTGMICRVRSEWDIFEDASLKSHIKRKTKINFSNLKLQSVSRASLFSVLHWSWWMHPIPWLDLHTYIFLFVLSCSGNSI